MKTGYSIRTWRMRLFCPERDMIDTTETLYKEAVNFYYGLLKDREDLWTESLLGIQGELERLTVPGRDGRVPVYTPPGMYKDLTDTSVTLKLWNGKKWNWVECNLTGRPLPDQGAVLSPTLVHRDKWLMFHIPVKQENSDARTARERMKEGIRICSVRFTNTDIFAMCCVLDEKGKQIGVKSCRGGSEYSHHCRNVIQKLEYSRQYTAKDNSLHPDYKYYKHLKHLNEYYAHQVSREILDFCKENQAGLIVFPEYDENFTRMAMYRSGNYSPLHLSTRIRTYLKYKAWSEGILVLEVRGEGIGKTCSICKAPGKKQGREFVCQNGHRINRFLNEARNLGTRCIESFCSNEAKKSFKS